MSAAHAYALPTPAATPRGPGPRHIEIVTTSAQRHARPRLVYSFVAIVGLFTVLAAQLLLSIALADGAYQISALQGQQKDLARSHQSVTEELNVLNSPQSLASRAESLGMVSNNSAVYLDLATGAVMGSPTAAKAGAGSVVGANGTLLVANSLLNGTPEMPAAPSNGTPTLAGQGAPVAAAPPGSVASVPTAIPGPTTR